MRGVVDAGLRHRGARRAGPAQPGSLAPVDCRHDVADRVRLVTLADLHVRTARTDQAMAGQHRDWTAGSGRLFERSVRAEEPDELPRDRQLVEPVPGP